MSGDSKVVHYRVDDAFDKQDSATNVFHKQRLLEAAIAELRILEETEKVA